jgi:hypothetical protein
MSDRFAFSLLWILALLFVPPPDVRAQSTIPQSVVGSGGADASSANYGIRGTIGQPTIGTVGSTSFGNLVGYWYNPGTTVTGIGDGDTIPKTFSLGQNHPNPFNPTTTIGFSLPKPSRVTLRIFDVSGRLVRTLADEEMPAGVHRKIWDATGVATGVYFYRIQAGDFVQTRKLVLLK